MTLQLRTLWNNQIWIITVIRITPMFTACLKKRTYVGGCLGYWIYKIQEAQWNSVAVAALESHIRNFPIFIGFCNNQIMNPHDNQIKKIKAKLEGFKDDICETKHLVFEAVKFDILQILSPVSETLQEVSLLTPKVMSMCRKVMRSFDKLPLSLGSWWRRCLLEGWYISHNKWDFGET